MKAVIVAGLFIVAVAAIVSAQDPWSKMHINPHTFTVSGVSAGAAMAIQYEFAYSSKVKGNGVVAGLPYNCAQGEMANAFICMDSPDSINLQTLLFDAQIAADLGQIDPLSNFKNHTVMLFSGLFDTVVDQGTMLKVEKMYYDLGTTSLTSFFNYTAEHAWITNFWGNTCSTFGTPYINNCGFDFAGAYLQQAWTTLGMKWVSTRGTYNNSNMYQIDVTQFGANALVSLDSISYVYVPQKCASGAVRCHLHINFHGCNQCRSVFDSPREYVSHTGLNEWAETNNIVIFYPQTVKSELLPMNPQGCFDWWGYTGSSYAVKSGPQMTVVDNVVNYFLQKS